jgi:protein-tyrosine phosphatase
LIAQAIDNHKSFGKPVVWNIAQALILPQTYITANIKCLGGRIKLALRSNLVGLFMIDLHSHILPGVDDGAPDMETSLAMARMAVADGIEVMACTPHFLPGHYENTADDIRLRVAAMNLRLIEEGINLALVAGADAHIRADFLDCLRRDQILRLHDSRYVLFEPSHVILPPQLEEQLSQIIAAGFVPILTHPERLKWIESHYDVFERLVKAGVWMQITAGSLTGKFGKRPLYWAQKMLAEGLVHILASDAHNTKSRPPILTEALAVARKELGSAESQHLVYWRPKAVLGNLPADEAAPLPHLKKPVQNISNWRRIFSGTKS